MNFYKNYKTLNIFFKTKLQNKEVWHNFLLKLKHIHKIIFKKLNITKEKIFFLNLTYTINFLKT